MNIKKMSILSFIFSIVALLGIQCSDKPGDSPAPPPVKMEELDVTQYLSTYDGIAKFNKQDKVFTQASENNNPTITVNTDMTYQTMDGFGFTLTGGSAMHLYNMSSSKRQALLNELFAHYGNHIGVSYLRVSIGASDLDAYTFSYNDLGAGETDVDMQHFSLAPDKAYLIPVLKEILAINPDIKILGSPWSAPTWMKTNGATKGGELKPEYYQAYANYFVKYVQEMAKEGIIIDAITVQNEPLHPGNNPSMYMSAGDQANFVKSALGPTFESEGINTKIIIYDHNADRTDYPISILDDAEANKYIDGSAFHLYGGDIGNLSDVHAAHPDKNLYFTEQWVGAPGNFGEDMVWHTRNLIVGASRNWCKTVLEWNLAADSDLKPYTDGGCNQCLGALTIDGDAVIRNPAYYIIAHASKFVRPGSVRVESNLPSGLPNVAFEAPDGNIVIVVLNDTDDKKQFNIELNDEMTSVTLASKSVGTFVWKQN
ncbi:glucosylceramidase [Saccharicrinis carchari]|uniref:Glucosylceramidase n=1 Tax=Saccharicrinis carchari TaxID=1168039 RepID=A0A521D4R2_SACCC|nr:glycoside hydrolase family 30 beta sandwich domain-containing protein [Saccharicrinis carchari]SMO66602.1 glucosylceramidase [Saccharicrinis carchari]